MSRINNNNGGGRISARLELELELNLSPPPAAAAAERMDVDGDDGIDSSSPSSCVSSDGSPAGGGKSSPMVIGACTRCLMYCMVARADYPICINCKQPFLIGLLPDSRAGAAAAAGDGDKRGKRK